MGLVIMAAVLVMVVGLDTVDPDMVPVMEGQLMVRLVTLDMEIRTAMSRTTVMNLTAIITRRNLQATAEARAKNESASRMKESVRASARLSFPQVHAKKKSLKKSGKTASADRM